ncbi:MAG TPA: aldehyde dehydrogenase family protein [Anaerolineae bacterium]|nr:aldehyde dehydrogenase family protein [Anaerolineae bacterium]
MSINATIHTNGTHTADSRILTFTNPATGQQFGQVTMTSPDEILAAREQMRSANTVWSQKPLAERIRILTQFKGLLIDSVDEISATLNQDAGKTRQDALIELFVTVDIMSQYLKHAPKWLARERIPKGLYFFRNYYTEQRPYGTVGVIGPWNYPLVLVLPAMFAALLAGNTVLIKPSEVTAATGVLIEQLINRIPDLAPFVRVLHGDGQVGAGLVASKPDLIFVTGSTTTGKKILHAAAEHLIPVITELGGKDPLLVLEDADVEAAAKWGVWGAFFNAGQTCMSVERVYVVEAVYDRFLQAVIAEAQNFKMGYDTSKQSPYSYGPLTFDRQLDTINDHLEDALAKGAHVLYGGRQDNLFMEPTILLNVNHSMKIMHEETFGPIMPIMKVKDEAEALALANDCDFGLGASVWTQDVKRGERLAHKIDSGTVLVNDTISHFAVPLLPFGGIKQSGNGRTHGREDLLQFTQTHAYSIGQPPLALDIATIMRYPGHYQLGKNLMHVAFGTSLKQRLAPIRETLEDEGTKHKLLAAATAIGATAVAWRWLTKK